MMQVPFRSRMYPALSSCNKECLPEGRNGKPMIDRRLVGQLLGMMPSARKRSNKSKNARSVAI
ncbi:hypothetical protein SAMN04488238_1027 [Roseicitreum antarcticum]|uniref:Uncharacterized protein n=1 Tax=Roseicitreum antarcticum TaxID=564137 RepID=A0A1H2TDR8_9RHOB|nr:hypothetical protein SAMN04488238_1027 [Roseicitreum antarcticum]